MVEHALIYDKIYDLVAANQSEQFDARDLTDFSNPIIASALSEFTPQQILKALVYLQQKNFLVLVSGLSDTKPPYNVSKFVRNDMTKGA